MNHVRYTPVILLLLLLPPADDICTREPGGAWEPLLLHQPPLLCSCCCSYHSGLGRQRLLFQFAHVKTEETTPRSQSSHNSASEVTDTVLYKAWDEPVTQFEKRQRNVVATSLMSTFVTTIWETSLLEEPLSGTDLTPCFFLLCTVLQLMDHKLGLSLCLHASPLTTERGSACRNRLLTGTVSKSRPKHIFRM